MICKPRVEETVPSGLMTMVYQNSKQIKRTEGVTYLAIFMRSLSRVSGVVDAEAGEGWLIGQLRRWSNVN